MQSDQLKSLINKGIEYQNAGKLDEAESVYKAILKNKPNDPNILHVLGIVALQKAEINSAIKLFKQAIDIKTDIAEIHNDCGLAYAQLKQNEIAVGYFKNAILIKPGFMQACYNLANSLIELNQTEEAISQYKKIISVNINDIYAHIRCGAALLKLEKYEDAFNMFNKAVQLNPKNMEANYNCAVSLEKQDQYQDALKYYVKALKINPDEVQILLAISTLYLKLDKLKKAIIYCEKAFAIDPDNPRTNFNLGNLLFKVGKYHEAIEHLNKTISINPEHVETNIALATALLYINRVELSISYFEKGLSINNHHLDGLNNYANALVYINKSQEAIPILKKILSLDPNHHGAYRNLVMIDPDHGHIEKLKNILSSKEISESAKVECHFALGYLYQHFNEYDKAFRHIDKANKIKRDLVEYSDEKHKKYIDKVIKNYSKEFFNKNINSNINSELPVFIVGMPRSGTTLVEQILASHPQVHGAGELYLFTQIQKDIIDKYKGESSYPKCVSLIDDELVKQLANYYLDKLKEYSQDAIRITDKMPFNYQRIGLIKMLLPKARFIHCRRNPVDICLSIYMNYFTKDNYYSFDQQEIAQYYLDYARLMNHWRTLFPDDIFELQYEELIENQEQVSKQLIEHIGLKWDASCLSFHNNARTVLTTSKSQVRTPIYKSAVEKWRHYEKHIQPMLNVLKGHV